MGNPDHPGLDVMVARLASRQHGVVAFCQLRGLGLSKKAIHLRSTSGRLHRIYRGVYAVGHRRLTRNGLYMAAVLACGPDAVLSHYAALVMWQLRSHTPGPIDVTVEARGRSAPEPIRLHCVRALLPDDHAVIDAIPVTTVPRTLLDIAEIATASQLRHALEAAERRQLLDARDIEALLARSSGRRGAKPLRQAIERHTGDAPWTQSRLERTMLSLVRDAGLPEPQCNVPVHGFLVDFYWPQYRLVVEVDGWEFHRTRAKFESDREQDATLSVKGVRTLRVTQRRLDQQPTRIAQDIRAIARTAA